MLKIPFGMDGEVKARWISLLKKEEKETSENNENRKITFGEGLAFSTLILSISAMDSENIILPTIIAFTSAIFLLKSAIKREKEIPTQTANQSGDE